MTNHLWPFVIARVIRSAKVIAKQTKDSEGQKLVDPCIILGKFSSLISIGNNLDEAFESELFFGQIVSFSVKLLIPNQLEKVRNYGLK